MTPKDCIVERTMRMFVSHGIRAVRMDDVAQQLGVSKRSLYELFGDKEGLLYQAMVRYFDDSRRRWAELSAGAGNVLEQLFMVLGDVMDRSEETGRLMDSLTTSSCAKAPSGTVRSCVRCSVRGSPTGFSSAA